MRTRTGAIALAAVLVLGVGVAATSQEDTQEIVFLARGDDPADALVIGPVAGRLGAPVLTTPGDRLDESVVAHLLDSPADLLVVAGGDEAITTDVVDELQRRTGLETSQILRVAGADRYATAAEVADLFERFGVAGPPELVVPASDHLVLVEREGFAADSTTTREVPELGVDAVAGETWVLRTTVSYSAGDEEDIILGFRAPDDASINVTGIGLGPAGTSAVGSGRFASDDADVPGLTVINAFGGNGPEADLAAELTATVTMGPTAGRISLVVSTNRAGDVPATVLPGTFLVADRVTAAPADR